MDLQKLVYGYETRYSEGFLNSEIEEIKSKFPKLNEEKFNNALMGVTGVVSPDGKFLTYHCDVLTALRCGIENRNMRNYEFD